MTLSFAIIAAVILGGALAAVFLRNLVHCALSLVVTFGGLAALFLQLQAEFIGFAQVLVYVGAVAILIVFAILLTRGGSEVASLGGPGVGWGLGLAAASLVVLVAAVTGSGALQRSLPPKPDASVRAIGDKLMAEYVVPLEVIGLLLTAAMIGAVIIAMAERSADGAKRRTDD